jgi:hypothetical protein
MHGIYNIKKPHWKVYKWEADKGVPYKHALKRAQTHTELGKKVKVRLSLC